MAKYRKTAFPTLNSGVRCRKNRNKNLARALELPLLVRAGVFYFCLRRHVFWRVIRLLFQRKFWAMYLVYGPITQILKVPAAVGGNRSSLLALGVCSMVRR